MVDVQKHTNVVMVKCMVCGGQFTNGEAGEHTRNTKHNRWELLVPRRRYFAERCCGIARIVSSYFLGIIHKQDMKKQCPMCRAKETRKYGTVKTSHTPRAILYCGVGNIGNTSLDSYKAGRGYK